MYLIHSTLRLQTDALENNRSIVGNEPQQEEQKLRYLAYLEVCARYSSQIIEIQRFLPGWVPEFR